jgi:hypothetical protein
MKKTQIYYPRTYRHFQSERRRQWLFFLIFVVPCLLILLIFYPEITRVLSAYVIKALSFIMPHEDLNVEYSIYLPIFGGIHYVAALPTTAPTLKFTLLNTAVVLILMWIALTRKHRAKPFFIYIAMNLLFLLLSCIFFIAAPSYFPYSATDYSELYIKLQLGIWLSFIVIAGVVIGFLTVSKMRWRICAFFGIILYSFVFGCVRYLTFLLILYKASILYMATLFFTLGPFFDFLYLVYLYAIFAKHVTTSTNNQEGRALWKWL